jgi:hypothetical protein
MWADEIETENSGVVELHHFDSETGIDTIEVLDDNGLVQRVIETRLHPTPISVGDPL